MTVPQAGLPELVAGRERVPVGDVAAIAVVVHAHRLGDRHKGLAAGVAGKIDQIHAQLIVDQPGDDLLGSRNHRLGNHRRVRPHGLDGVGVDRLRHADAEHGGLHDHRLPGGKPAAEREHHDAREADADDEHPALALPENARRFPRRDGCS